MKNILIFIIFILGIILLKSFSNEQKDVISVKLNNQKEYLVLNYKDKYEAASLLEDIRKNLMKLKNHLIKTYGSKVNNLKSRFTDSTEIIESAPNPEYTSYTLNKGEKMVFCLRSLNDNTLHKKNTLMFVAIHELAHVLSDEIGHKDEFHKNFKFLLKEAIKINIYKNINYNKTPQNYCGMEINENPLIKIQ